MSEANARAMIAIRMEQAKQTFNDARMLMAIPQATNRTIVNRAYYAAFYALLALLQTRDEKPKKHSGAIAMFDRAFVKTGIFEKWTSQHLHELFDERMEDDYILYTPVERESAEQAMVMSEKFIEAVERYLTDAHLLETPGDK